MLEYLLIYLAFCLFVGLLGRSRKLGFWGYFFFSIITTPLLGMVMVFASDPIDSCKRGPLLNEQQRGAIDYCYEQVVRSYEDRIAQLIRSGRITQEHAERELSPLLKDLRKTLRFGPNGPIHGPLDVVLRVLEQLPARVESRTARP